MPYMDGTGPNGMGPVTGRGMGPCNRGVGLGRGRGFGGRMFWGDRRYTGPLSLEEEEKMLEEQLKAVREEKERSNRQ